MLKTNGSVRNGQLSLTEIRDIFVAEDQLYYELVAENDRITRNYSESLDLIGHCTDACNDSILCCITQHECACAAYGDYMNALVACGHSHEAAQRLIKDLAKCSYPVREDPFSD